MSWAGHRASETEVVMPQDCGPSSTRCWSGCKNIPTKKKAIEVTVALSINTDGLTSCKKKRHCLSSLNRRQPSSCCCRSTERVQETWIKFIWILFDDKYMTWYYSIDTIDSISNYKRDKKRNSAALYDWIGFRTLKYKKKFAFLSWVQNDSTATVSPEFV